MGWGRREKVDCIVTAGYLTGLTGAEKVLAIDQTKVLGLCIFNTNNIRGRDIPGAGIKVPVK